MSSPLRTDALAGRRVAVTGATGGIGQRIAERLAGSGAELVLQYRSSAEVAHGLATSLPTPGHHVVRADLSEPSGARAFWREALGRTDDRLDALVLGAAIAPATGLDAPDTDWDTVWRETFDVNVLASVALLREAGRTFAARGAGTIVVISSWAAEQGSRIESAIAYAASKAAVRNAAQSLARLLADQGVTVHILAPGVVDAGMGIVGSDPAVHAVSPEVSRTGHLVGADEVATLVALLLSGSVPSMTGSTVDLNGASYIR